jgi:hypothetical protein
MMASFVYNMNDSMCGLVRHSDTSQARRAVVQIVWIVSRFQLCMLFRTCIESAVQYCTLQSAMPMVMRWYNQLNTTSMATYYATVWPLIMRRTAV